MKEFKICIAGSRSFNDYKFLVFVLDKLLLNIKDRYEIVIISGTAKGADKLGEQYAEERNYKILRFPADWDLYGKKAGFIRNKEMAIICDTCVIFWDGKSPGSKLMHELCKKMNKAVRLVKFK